MSFLYKYLPSERETYLKDALLRFTPPSALNDPYECLPGITEKLERTALQLLETNLSKPPAHFKELSRNERRIEKQKYEKKVRSELQKLKRDPAIFIESFYTRAANNMNNNLGILSLSKRWDSALMWSHYTESHQGFCVGFNSEHNFFSKKNKNAETGDFIIEPVVYSDNRPLLQINAPNKKKSFEILFTKSLDWEYEQEVRAISTLKYAAKTIDAEPYKLSLFQVPHDAISEIIIGLRANETICQSATKLAKKLSVPAYKANLSKLSFDVERELLEA